MQLGDPILTLDGTFNLDNEDLLFALKEDQLSDIKSNDDFVSAIMTSQVTGICDINNGLLKTTLNHIHIVKRTVPDSEIKKWIAIEGYQLVVGDILWHITNGEIPITSVAVDNTNIYTVYKLDVEPNDIFYANGILTHNRKCSPDDYCNGRHVCYDRERCMQEE